MQPVSELIVLDFSNWLYEKTKKRKADSSSILDYFSEDKLVSYANEFLNRSKTPCKNFLISFLNSNEFNCTVNDCDQCCDFYNPQNSSPYFNYCFDCHNLKKAYYSFIRNYEYHFPSEGFIDPNALAEAFQNIIQSDSQNINDNNALLNLMSNSPIMSNESDFLEWLKNNEKHPEAIWKMPYSTYEMLVNQYTSDVSVKKKLLKAYKQTGWDKLFTRLKTLVNYKAHETKGVKDIIERYFSENIFKCIILPLTDPESQQTYEALINDSWQDLNDYSGQYLDIYYNDHDTGKTGYMIANQIASLPEEIKYKSPCVVLWKDTISETKTISIKNLNNRDIVSLIQSIVLGIRNNKELNTIVEEANIKVKKLIDEKKGITNNYITNVNGNQYSVNTGDVSGIVNIASDSNTITGNTLKINQNKYAQLNTEDFDKAVNMINELSNANAEIKNQLTDIIKTAKCGVEEKSEEKCNDAKSKFSTLKPMLKEYLPKALEIFANIATIATFFGLSHL